MTFFPRIAAALSAPVPAQSLAVFRVAFGALMVWDCWRFVHHDRIGRYYVEPDFLFTYAGFGWVRPLPEPWIHWAWLGVGVLGAMVMLGLFYRVAIVAFTLLFLYFFLLDKAQYLNHFYLILLFAALLCVIPAHRVWSLDAWRRAPAAPTTVPYAAVFALRAQLEIVLIYAGLVKLGPDWLNGQPLAMWLAPHVDTAPFGWLLAQPAVIVAGAWGAVALHLIGAPLLMIPRTRLAAFCVYCAFHMANAYFFNIGVFPWLTIAATTIFFAPDWPSRLGARLRRSVPPAAPPASLAPPAVARRLPVALMAALALWLGAQVAAPLRFLAFPAEVGWRGEGHRFAWRMRLYDRQADGVFVIRDLQTGAAAIVDPYTMLTDRQARTMLTRADMIRQFAVHLRETAAREHGRDIAVHAVVRKSLNGRRPQMFVDHAVDLSRQPRNLFGADSWILPLVTPLRAEAPHGLALARAADGRE